VYIIHFDAVAVLLIGITLFLFYNQKKVPDHSSRRFAFLLWTCLGSALFSMLGSLAIDYPRAFGFRLESLLNVAFFLFHNAIPVAVAGYVISICGKATLTKTEMAILYFPYLAAAALILSSPVNGFLFYFDADLGYHHGPGFLSLYLLSFCYLAFTCFRLFGRRRMFSRQNLQILPAALIIPLAAAAFQNQLPGVQLECFAASISLLLILFTIQNSSELVDSTTGLFNRAAFIKWTETNLKDKTGFDVILLCIPNAPLLHQTFDLQNITNLFKAMAIFLADINDDTGTLFYLGDEFFALLFNRDISEKAKRKLINGIRERYFQPWDVGSTQTAISVRQCLLQCPEEASSVMEIFDCLELMTTLSIRDGHSGIIGAEDLNLLNRKRDDEVEKAIRAALAASRLKILYQPIFSVAKKRYAMADALMALKEESDERIQQSELIRVAEYNGLMQRIGSLALQGVCHFFIANALAEKGIEQIQIRLAGSQCLQSDLAQQILTVTEARKMDPRRICFEVTETSAVNSPDIMNINMKMLAGQNFSFALDDYGSGYTDLDYILDLPFTMIKLDKSIIRAGFESSRGRIILESTILLIKKLDRLIIAEGVETAEQAQVLTWLGCDYLQGFYFSPPVTAEEFLKLLARPAI